jgi:hypothetical protein
MGILERDPEPRVFAHTTKIELREPPPRHSDAIGAVRLSVFSSLPRLTDPVRHHHLDGIAPDRWCC